MTDLSQIAPLLYGSRWQTDLADALGVSSRLVRAWVSGERGVPAWVAPRLLELLQERGQRIDEARRELADLQVMPPAAPPA